MATGIDLPALQKELKGFQGKIDSWTQRTVSTADQTRQEHGHRIKDLQDIHLLLHATGLSEEKAQLLAAQTAAVQAAAEEAALPILLAEQRSMVEEVDRELQAQQSIVASAEAQNLAKLGALEHDAHRLLIGLNDIDPRQPEREFTFAVHIQGSDTYSVSNVSQELPELPELQAALQSTGNFCAFVRGMRTAFVAAVSRESPP
ncbi:Kinetochore protein Spc25 [Auxenochlorella protothecoides]|uniref:Kinetochore protein SPC25 n=1 Tax=Auxenochlorella protothecoides TaxID=3075 RepID=A0A087SM59_AUXPR|nr:Kinetochore protein Spc25 [Auxenochlorella protothecoides]KFM26813.1 Kinetochore protein Spc25 [Auxenochlorella protothecoides]